jgi:putative hydrolase of the HAD superfamily
MKSVDLPSDPPTIFWDFDGTLATRMGSWSGAMLSVLDICVPGHHLSREDLLPHLQHDFPWHNPDIPHYHLSTPDAWWSYLESILARAFQAVGFEESLAKRLAQLTHKCYINPNGFILYEDSIPVLKSLSENGWKHVILSNNVPELPVIVGSLAISQYIAGCISSASIGFEKPNPEAFRIALASAGNPRRVWVIGDNLTADVKGAEAAGLPAILVRSSQTHEARYYAHDLLEAASIVKTILKPVLTT